MVTTTDSIVTNVQNFVPLVGSEIIIINNTGAFHGLVTCSNWWGLKLFH